MKGDPAMNNSYCYVVPPGKVSRSDWQYVFDVLISPIAEKKGMKCVLGQVMGEALIDNILAKLLQADLAIIDVSGDDDPRAYYQLGVRHARSNRTILIGQHDTNIISDFKPYYVVTYSSAAKDITKFQQQLESLIDRIRCAPDEPDNPVQRFLSGAGKLIEENHALQSKLEELEKTVRDNKNLQSKVTELERTLTTLASAPQEPPHQTIKFKPVPPGSEH